MVTYPSLQRAGDGFHNGTAPRYAEAEAEAEARVVRNLTTLGTRMPPSSRENLATIGTYIPTPSERSRCVANQILIGNRGVAAHFGTCEAFGIAMP